MSSNGKIKIEKGVQFERRDVRCGHEEKYPWADMELGDSFLFDPNIKDNSAYNIGRAASIRHGKKFRVSATKDGMRCWRTA